MTACAAGSGGVAWAQAASSDPAGARSVRLVDVASKLCLDGAGGQGDPARERACDDGAASQRWAVEDAGAGRVVLVNAANALALDDAGESRTSGAGVILWQRHGRANQQWTLPAASGALRNAHSDLVAGTRRAPRDGSRVIQVAAGSTAARAWRVAAADAGTPSPSTSPSPSVSPSPSASPSPSTSPSPTGTAPAGWTRSKYTQPFASDSIWNMPIGSGASYVPAGLPAPKNGVLVDQDWWVTTDDSDPLVDTRPPGAWGPGRCSVDSQHPEQPNPALRDKIHLPSDLIVPDATDTPYFTPNNASAILRPDGKTIDQFEPTARCTAGSPLTGWRAEPESIYGDGIRGGHYGSGLSSIGGTIRKGEILGDAPIRHALKIDVWGMHLAYNDDGTRGYRWPATNADGSAATQYKGTNPHLEMGALLAIAPGTTAESLGLTTPEGRKIFAALRDYGAYVVDDSGWDAAYLCAEKGAEEEYRAATGQDWGSGAWQTDLRKLVPALDVVDDNAPGSVGGGGTPRVPMAPALAD